MFYKTTDPHGLRGDPLKAIIVPRPIGWISTVDREGRVNLAPYSFFNGVAANPPQVMFAASGQHSGGGLKDTVKNIQETKEFVLNLATWKLRGQIVATAVEAPRDVNEFEYAGLTEERSELVTPPRVKESPVHLECVHTKTVELLADDPDSPNTVIFGRVLGVSIADYVIEDGRVNPAKLRPLARLGYSHYAAVEEVFSLKRPSWEE